MVETCGGVDEDGEDELFGNDGEEEDTSEDGEDFVAELVRADAGGTRVFEFVAEGGAEEVVEVVGPGQVFGVGNAAEGRGELVG